MATLSPPPPAPHTWKDLLGAGLAAAAAEELDSQPTSALGASIVDLLRHVDAVLGEVARRVGSFEGRHGHRAEGASSMVSWLVARGHRTPGAAAELASVARHLPELPHVATALRDGEIGYAHAAVLAHAADQIGVEPVREAEETLVEAARHLHVVGLRELTRRLRECVDAEAALRDANREHDRRRLHLSRTLEGVFYLDGRLDAEGGAVLSSALNALCAPIPDDHRSPAQRRADALVEMAHRLLRGGGLPTVAGQRPHLTVIAPEATLRGEPGSPGGQLGWSGAVTGDLVRRLACDASLTTLTVGPGGEPRVATRARPAIQPATRRALVARDRGCRWPGCERPPEWTDAHHLRPRAALGSDDIDNLALLCRPHHRCVHEGGWRLVRDPGGGLRAIPP